MYNFRYPLLATSDYLGIFLFYSQPVSNRKGERVKSILICEENFSSANAKVPRNSTEAVWFSLFLLSLSLSPPPPISFSVIFSINVKDQETWIPTPAHSLAALPYTGENTKTGKRSEGCWFRLRGIHGCEQLIDEWTSQVEEET